jgi:Protein of unknown function (DUF4199)
MKKTTLTFGLISGALSSLMMVATIPFADRIGFDHSYLVGYTVIVLSFLLVFFGIRSYRDNIGDGQITFARAFAVGISISLISCICYVATWEVLYFHFLPGFMDKSSAYGIAKVKASGASPSAIQDKLQQLKKYKEIYDNPFLNAAVTFIEPFPIGLLVTLISAAVLRKKPRSQPTNCPCRHLLRPASPPLVSLRTQWLNFSENAGRQAWASDPSRQPSQITEWLPTRAPFAGAPPRARYPENPRQPSGRA